MEKGYIHVYTGNGKGKTTASFGLALRALCSGKSVYIGQFVKSMKYNETKITEKFNNIQIEQLGIGCFINKPPTKEDAIIAKKGLEKCEKIMSSGEYDMVILDELTIAIYYSLINIEEVIEALSKRNSKCEVIITGRYAPQELIDYADLVTEMKEIKHYYKQGVLSRNGIDK
ncbi:MAG: cob(I)yrinic acid a,c-diamide adenosyltransferase [Bacteroidetes bacterium]|nr:cob(I)yrinic acid a,c-diamide adenosyltransferase [Bacteroidota bacterium]